MMLRYMQLMTVTVGIGALIACSGDDPTGTTDKNTTDDGGDDDGGDDDDDDDGGVDTVDTAATNGFFNASDIYVGAYFTYDAANQIPVTGNSDYGPIDPAYEITLALSSWNNDPAATTDYCFIALVLLNATPRPEAIQDPRLWYGVDYNPAEGAFANCDQPGYELDPYYWGDDAVGEWLIDAEFYSASVGELTQAAADVIKGADPTLIPLTIGGQLGVPEWLPSDVPGLVDDVYGFVSPIDQSFNIDFSGDVLAADVNQGTNIAPGFYNLSSLVYWSLAI